MNKIMSVPAKCGNALHSCESHTDSRQVIFNAAVTASDINDYRQILRLVFKSAADCLYADIWYEKVDHLTMDSSRSPVMNDDIVKQFILAVRFISLYDGFVINTANDDANTLAEKLHDFLFYRHGEMSYLRRYYNIVGDVDVECISVGAMLAAMFYKKRMNVQELKRGTPQIGTNKCGMKNETRPAPTSHRPAPASWGGTGGTEIMSRAHSVMMECIKHELKKCDMKVTDIDAYQALQSLDYIFSQPVSHHSYQDLVGLPFMCDDIECYLSYTVNLLARKWPTDGASEYVFIHREQACQCKSYPHIVATQGHRLLAGTGLELFNKLSAYLLERAAKLPVWGSSHSTLSAVVHQSNSILEHQLCLFIDMLFDHSDKTAPTTEKTLITIYYAWCKHNKLPVDEVDITSLIERCIQRVLPIKESRKVVIDGVVVYKYLHAIPGAFRALTDEIDVDSPYWQHEDSDVKNNGYIL